MFDFARGLVSRGHTVTVYTTDVLTLEDWRARSEKQNEVMDGISVHRLRRLAHSHRLPTKVLKFLSTGPDRADIQALGAHDVVHIAEVSHPLALRFSALARRAGVPYVVSIFGDLSAYQSLPMQMLATLFRRLWGRQMLGNAAALLVQTPHEGEASARYAMPERVVPMFLPVNTQQFSHLPDRGRFRGKWGIDDSEKIILYLGRVHQYKGVQHLMHASANILRRQQARCRLVIAGSDEGYRKSLVGQAARLGVTESVVFTGPIFGTDKLEAYVDADVFVTTPTIYEETSLAALEACACGTPVVITERNAIPLLEEYEAGFQVHYGDGEELGNALRRLLDDGGLAKRMGENARELVHQEYALDKVVSRLEGLLLRLCDGGAG